MAEQIILRDTRIKLLEKFFGAYHAIASGQVW
jgi:hypothetical protein